MDILKLSTDSLEKKKKNYPFHEAEKTLRLAIVNLFS